MNRLILRAGLLAIGGSAAVAIAAANAQERRPALPSGKALFEQYGCFSCHGHAGGGGAAGPAIFGLGHSPERVMAYLRRPAGVMPPYRRNVLDDGKAMAIAYYVSSAPASKPYAQVAALARLAPKATPIGSAAPPSAKRLYDENCAACHGAGGEGTASAPALLAEASKRTPAGTAALIIRPPARMPSLVPQAIAAHDVPAIAEYVHSLGSGRVQPR